MKLYRLLKLIHFHSTPRYLLAILIGLSACSADQEKNFQEIVDNAIRSGQTEIQIPDGRYTITKPIELQGQKNLTIKATKGKTVLTSCMRLSIKDFVCLDKKTNLYQITMPELVAKPWPDSFRGYSGWPEIFIDGVMMKIARWPNEGYVKIDRVIEQGSVPRNADSNMLDGRFMSDTLKSVVWEHELTKENPLYLGGYWCYKWYDEYLQVASLNIKTGEVKLAAPHRYGIGGPSGGLFYAINQPEFLDNPGEFTFNTNTGTIQLILPETAGKNPVIEISYQDFTLFDMQNCVNIRIDGLDFQSHNGYAFEIYHCDDVVLNNCNFRGFAQSVITIEGGQNCGINSCMLADIGSTPISLQGGDRITLSPSRHFVTKSEIHHYARHIKTYAPAVNLFGVGQIVSQNYIHDAPHNAILFVGNDHLIDGNTIERVCWDTSDAGAIYCGRDWTMGGTIIKNNHISDLGQASHHHNWAIYLDDLASGIEVLNNTIENCPSGILIGGGRYNRIEANSITNCPKASIMYDARGLNWYIQYLDDPQNEIWQRLWAMPISKSPWLERFPWLININKYEAGIPKKAIIRNNIIVNSHIPEIHPSVVQYAIEFKL